MKTTTNGSTNGLTHATVLDQAEELFRRTPWKRTVSVRLDGCSIEYDLDNDWTRVTDATGSVVELPQEVFEQLVGTLATSVNALPQEAEGEVTETPATPPPTPGLHFRSERALAQALEMPTEALRYRIARPLEAGLLTRSQAERGSRYGYAWEYALSPGVTLADLKKVFAYAPRKKATKGRAVRIVAST
jgi:hypothetical protein